jgi:hypothetical protein
MTPERITVLLRTTNYIYELMVAPVRPQQARAISRWSRTRSSGREHIDFGGGSG